jgi:hypothetical protein
MDGEIYEVIYDSATGAVKVWRDVQGACARRGGKRAAAPCGGTVQRHASSSAA